MYIDQDTGVMIHDKNNIIGMRKAGKLAAEVLDYITPFVKPGVTTETLDKKCYDFILKNKAIPAPLNYKGFPKSICTSINHVICHGIPGEKILLNGDILNIDITVILDGWHGDTSRMFWVGKPSIKAIKLIETTFEAMWRGIKVVKPGATLGDIGFAIQNFAEKKGYSVVRDFCGHGIGRVFHDSPSVLHYGNKNEGIKLKEGMFFTIEPMINVGKFDVKILSDGWTAVTRDKSLSAQFEHTICVTSSGYEVFTLSPKNLNYPPFNL
ncbi:MAG: type I methionyl aminopeptidase [Alphaproteobacteria bacterium]|jgi:methionyl aminopeptidase|nr:type I methionyl aminopeptidase [Alphaproteobacteria bacterium]|tara:strand:- start:2365 stop:3165 length:801 start_codon:yes stop_codon:yes gene_type:complete